jgi:hypothetical protein
MILLLSNSYAIIGHIFYVPSFLNAGKKAIMAPKWISANLRNFLYYMYKYT